MKKRAIAVFCVAVLCWAVLFIFPTAAETREATCSAIGHTYPVGADEKYVSVKLIIESKTAFTAGSFNVVADGLSLADCKCEPEDARIYLNKENNKVLFAGFDESTSDQKSSYEKVTLEIMLAIDSGTLAEQTDGKKWNVFINNVVITNENEENYRCEDAACVVSVGSSVAVAIPKKEKRTKKVEMRLGETILVNESLHAKECEIEDENIVSTWRKEDNDSWFIEAKAVGETKVVCTSDTEIITYKITVIDDEEETAGLARKSRDKGDKDPESFLEEYMPWMIAGGTAVVLIAVVLIIIIAKKKSKKAKKKEALPPVAPVTAEPAPLNTAQDVKFCTECGMKNSADAKFCKSCGKPLF